MLNPKPKRTFKTESKKPIKESLEERTLLSWMAPARPFKKPKKEYFTTIGTIVGLVIVILLFLKETLLIGVILALCFVGWVLATVPPKEIENKITTRGVYSEKHFYPWEQLDSFWFTESHGQKVLNIATYLRFPNQIFVLLGSKKEKEVKEALLKNLRFNPNPPRSFLDDAAEFLAKKIPLEGT